MPLIAEGSRFSLFRIPHTFIALPATGRAARCQPTSTITTSLRTSRGHRSSRRAGRAPHPRIQAASTNIYAYFKQNETSMNPSGAFLQAQPTTGIPVRTLKAAMAPMNALANTFEPVQATAESSIGVELPKKGHKSKHALRKLQQKALQRMLPGKKDLDASSSEESSDRNGARAPPSAASGGVPEPSTAYLARAVQLPSQLAAPRRILVILDLNGTLLFRPSKRRPSHFIERPCARQFLNYCLDTFYLAIWSSARPQNVSNMVAQLLTKEQRSRCVIIWARDRFGLSKADYDARVQVYKRLSIVWNNKSVIASHPDAAAGVRWDQSNTVLVDDSREKGRSEPHNILTIPEFGGLGEEPAHILPQVHDYLNTLASQTDISRYMQETPFRLDAEYSLPDLS